MACKTYNIIVFGIREAVFGVWTASELILK